MAKYNKYLQHAKSRKKTEVNIDLQQIAVEYSRLLNKKFCYIFSGGEKIEFQFKTENFYHLLGFHKLTDVTVVKLVENFKLKKEDFFKYIKNGKITMDSIDSTILGDIEDKIVHIKETSRKSDFGEIKVNRFNFFSEIQMLELLKNDPVIDFDSKDCYTVIDANKIFFKLVVEKNRNLNLFIGFDENNKKYYVSTFFLEQEANKFLIKKTGIPQNLLKIISISIINTENNELIDFYIKWENVRNEFVNEYFYRGQSRLKTWIKSKHISSNQIKKEISIQNELIKEYEDITEELELKYNIIVAVNKLEIADEREEAELKLIEYNIDADNEEEIDLYRQFDFLQIKNDKLKMENKLSALKNKLEKHEKYLPYIVEMEFQEVVKAYQVYLPEIEFEREQVIKVIESYSIFDDIITPLEFKELYSKVLIKDD